MKKKNAVQTISIPSAHSNNTLIHQTSNVSAKITLSDSILSGAVIEYRKAGYNFIRHLHTNIDMEYPRQQASLSFQQLRLQILSAIEN